MRGAALTWLSEEFVEHLGFVSAQVLGAHLGARRLVIGADTRASSPQLTAALTRGAQAAGAEVINLGIVATPVVSFACELWDCCGAMVSASHNPWTDNGVKLFARGGTKLNDETEQEIAQELERAQPTATEPTATGPIATSNPGPTPAQPAPAQPTPAQPAPGPAEILLSYKRSLSAGISGRNLNGLHLVTDTANGATAPYAADMLSDLGAQVQALFDAPNGRNINAGCGSMFPQALQDKVVQSGADLGLSFDGDGDRLIAVDNAGHLINGDRLMVLFACDLAAADELAKRTLVTTVMSNLGLREALAAADISIMETPVGDRYVLNAIDAGGFDLGGEQSGHIIFRRLAATGDGLRSGVHLADLVLRSKQASSAQANPTQASPALTSAELASQAMTEYPQVLKNIAAPTTWHALPAQLETQVNEIAAAADPHTRVLVRPSGTEPLVRVMVEAADSDYAELLASQLIEVVRTHLQS